MTSEIGQTIQSLFNQMIIWYKAELLNEDVFEGDLEPVIDRKNQLVIVPFPQGVTEAEALEVFGMVVMAFPRKRITFCAEPCMHSNEIHHYEIGFRG
jgi:hypothetical protein